MPWFPFAKAPWPPDALESRRQVVISNLKTRWLGIKATGGIRSIGSLGPCSTRRVGPQSSWIPGRLAAMESRTLGNSDARCPVTLMPSSSLDHGGKSPWPPRHQGHWAPCGPRRIGLMAYRRPGTSGIKLMRGTRCRGNLMAWRIDNPGAKRTDAPCEVETQAIHEPWDHARFGPLVNRESCSPASKAMTRPRYVWPIAGLDAQFARPASQPRILVPGGQARQAKGFP